MLKNFGLQGRKAGLDHAAFVRHWIGVHAPLARAVPVIKGYVINEVLERLPGGAPAEMPVQPELDGIAQQWYDSADSMRQMAQLPEAKPMFADGPNYLGARTGLASSERLVRAPGAQRPGFKLLRLLERPATLSAAEFSARWQGDWATRVAALGGAAGYVQSDVSAVTPATNMTPIQVGAVCAVEEWWFASLAEVRQAAAPLAAAHAAVGPLFGAAAAFAIAETVMLMPPAA